MQTRTMEKITTAACTSSKTIGDVVRDILVKQVQDGLLRSRYPEQQYEYSSRVTQHLSVSDAEYVRRQFARFRYATAPVICYCHIHLSLMDAFPIPVHTIVTTQITQIVGKYHTGSRRCFGSTSNHSATPSPVR